MGGEDMGADGAAGRVCQGCGRPLADEERGWPQDWVEVYPEPRSVVLYFCDTCHDGPMS